MRARLLVSAVTGSLLAAVTTGCTRDTPSEPTNVIDGATYVELYQETIDDFPETLPDAVEFPETPPPMGGQIGRGNAAGAAYFYWLCAWEDVYLTDLDSTTRATAMEQMRKFPQTSWGSRYYLDPDNVWGSTLDAAELGDLTELRAFNESDCAFYRTANGT